MPELRGPQGFCPPRRPAPAESQAVRATAASARPRPPWSVFLKPKETNPNGKGKRAASRPLAWRNTLWITEVGCCCLTTQDGLSLRARESKNPDNWSSFPKRAVHSGGIGGRGRESARVLFLVLFLLGGPLAAVYWRCSSTANGEKPGCRGGLVGAGVGTSFSPGRRARAPRDVPSECRRGCPGPGWPGGPCKSLQPSPLSRLSRLPSEKSPGPIVSQVVLNELIVYLTPMTRFEDSRMATISSIWSHRQVIRRYKWLAAGRHLEGVMRNKAKFCVKGNRFFSPLHFWWRSAIPAVSSESGTWSDLPFLYL